MYTVCAFTDNVTVLVLTRFIDGIGASVKVPLCLALATEFLPEEKGRQRHWHILCCPGHFLRFGARDLP